MQIEGMIQGRTFLFAYNVLEIDYSEYAMLFKIELIWLNWKVLHILTTLYVPNQKTKSFLFVNIYFLKLLHFFLAQSNNLLLYESMC